MMSFYAPHPSKIRDLKTKMLSVIKKRLTSRQNICLFNRTGLELGGTNAWKIIRSKEEGPNIARRPNTTIRDIFCAL